MENNVNASIRVNLDTSEALSSLQSLQTRISSFNKSVIQSNAQAVAAQRGLLSNFQAEIGSSRQFSTSIRTSATEVSRLQTAIDKNKLSTGQYFKYAAASSKNFGKIFTQENEKITRLATERVRSLQTQYIALGEAQGGMQKSLLVKPLNLFNANAAISVQKMQIFNKLLRDGGTSILNWGKNTQWAGRQLMVGFTVPLTIFGATASKIFMDLEEQAISFKKVYGDIFTTTAEVEENLEAVRGLSEELTKYGIAITDTMETANVAAQAGFRGEDLMSQTQEATRLAVLGQMEQSEAMRTTITLQNAFKLSNEDLADAVNYLNIVENQTVLSIQDFAGAIPRVAPVIQSLGGDVRDLSVMLVAMREGGVTAAEGANALKTSLARLISPTSGASSMAKELGINLDGIVEANQGDILGAVMQLAKAMEGLDELAQQRLLSEIFGKRQYARIGALFNNITDEASQSARALDLASMSVEQLAETANNELGVVEQAIGTKFAGAVERLKLAIAPIGEIFLKIATPIINVAGNLLEKFNELSPTAKNFVAILAAGVGIVVPSVLMLVGLFGNLLGNLVKGFGTLNTFFNRLKYGAEATQYLSGEQLDAAAAAASLEGQTTSLTGSLNIQREAVDQLSAAYRRYVAGANAAASNLPQGFRRPVTPATMATGGIVGGVGNKDTEPALLTPGEFVINADASKKFAPLLAAINEGKIGKYADGRTQLSVGGRSFDVNVPHQTTLRSVQERLERAFSMGAIEFEQLSSIVDNFGDTLISTVKQLDTEIKNVGGSLLEVLPKSSRETNYSYPGSESVEESLTRVGVPSAQIERELAAANISAQGAVDAVDQNADLLRQLGYSQEELAVEAGIARSHMQEVDKSLGLAAWEPDFWIAQSQAENQFLNAISGSTRNQEMLESYLIQQLDSAEDATALMQKIKSGVGLTENEFEMLNQGLTAMLNDVRSSTEKAAQIKSATSKNFLKGAIATTGAASARRAAGVSYDTGRLGGVQTISGLRDGVDANSESRQAQMVANDVIDGFTNQLERRASEAYVSAEMVGEKATEGVRSGTSDIRVLLKESLDVGPLVEQEQANLRETIALRKEENKQLLRRAQLLMIRGYTPEAAKRIAAEEMAAAKAAAAAPAASRGRGGDRFGLQYAPKSVQDDLIKATKNASNNLNNVGKQSGQVAKRFSRLKGGVSKFGGALKNGSMKMQGAFFAMDGLVFAASMMNNRLGEIAQKALPVVFGLQGISMVLPMLKGVLLALISPAGLIVGGLVALAGAVFLMKKNLENMFDNAVDAGIEAAGSMRKIAESADIFSKSIRSLAPEKLQIAPKKQGKVAEYFETEEGQAKLEELLSQRQQLGRTAFSEELGKQIAFEAATKGLSGKEIEAYIAEIANQLGDKKLYVDLKGRLIELLDPQGRGENILKDGLIVDIKPELAGKFIRGEANFTQQMQRDVMESLSQVDEFLDASAIQERAVQDAVAIGNTYEDLGRQIKQASKELNDALASGNQKYIDEADKRLQELQRQQREVMPGQLTATNIDLAGRMQGRETPAETQKAFEKATDAASKYGKSLFLNRQALALYNDAVERGAISQKEYEKMASGVATQFIRVKKFAGQAIDTLEGLDNTTALKAFREAFTLQTFAGIDEEMRTKITDALKSVSDKAVVTLGVEYARGSITEQEIIDLANVIDRLPTDHTRQTKIIVAYGEGSLTTANLEVLANNLENISSFDGKQVDFLLNLGVLGEEKFAQAIQMMLAVDKMLSGETTFIAGQVSGAETKLAQLKKEADEAKALMDQLFGGGEEDGKGMGETEETGGSAEKSFLEDFIDNINANAKLYLDAEKGLKGYMKNRGKFLGAFQKLRNRGLSEDIISSLGTGPEGLKNAKELLKKNREQIKKLSEASRLDSLGQTVESLRREKGKTKEKTAAARAIKGLSPELQDIVMNDEQFISSFAKVKVGSKEYNKLVKEVQKLANAKRELAEETQTEFEAQEQATKAMIDSLELQIKKNEDDLINAFEKTHGMLPEMMELEISKREESIRVIQKQIDELEELNEIDEERIEGLSRQQEMLERQIEVLDRANEMDQRRIELLNRQDEIRSRESEALSKELDDMSKIEQELRDSHQKRVEQLEKVADVNDYILNQQKQQLNISRAISEGDIYSATAAAQEMRAGSAEFSKRQLISGLEAGLENQVSNLRTSDGLTRDQAERQIANIKEQSYQTSLQIRQIEDMIYQRNQQMIPLKDQQYSLDMQIRDIEDLIYDRNVQKKQIFDEQIDPLQRQNNLQNEYLRKLNIEIDHVNGPLKAKQNHLDRILQLEAASQKVTGEIRDMTIKARKKADDLSRSWNGVTGSIVAALGALTQFNGAKAAKSYAGGIVEGYSKGGKIKGYSVGGVAGNGSRDSVPAMLTPGEFVIRKAMVNKYGQSMMHDINMGSFSMPGYGAPGRSSNVSPADVSVSNISSINAPVYNVYDMNFSINGSNQSADEIANRVMVKMRQLQSHNIRSNRGN